MALSLLRLDGEVEQPLALAFEDLAALDPSFQIPDVRRVDPARKGSGVRLAGLLAQVKPKALVQYLTLHSSTDDFHASIPLAAVRDRAILIYSLDGGPLPASAGGPVRFLIPDFAACHAAEIDECANVKFVDHIEFSVARRFDNRPHDEREHAALHGRGTP